MRGLDRLLPLVQGRSLLDLGCAEGIVLEHLLRGRPAAGHGVDNSETRIELARSAHGDPRLRFDVADLNDPACLESPVFQPSYDMMLMLLVYQHLTPQTRTGVLRSALARCRSFFVLNSATLHAGAGAVDVIRGEGFALESQIPTRGQQSMLVFKRTAASA